MTFLTIDGSYGEGGGQLSRYAMALSAITGQPLHLTNIRAKRARQGLMPQHLAALKAIAAVTNGVLEGAELGATEIRFRPGRVIGGEYHFAVGTAGSIALVLQALLPVALHANGPMRLTIAGGTDVKMAPPIDYLRLVFLPWLERMGIRVSIESVRHGYFPKGGGEVTLTVRPCRQPRALMAENPGPLRSIQGIAHVAHLPLHIAARMAASARAELVDLAPAKIEARVLRDEEAYGTGGAMVLVAETENSLLGAATVAERGVPAEQLGQDAGRALRAELESASAVDIHASDQLLIYAAQAQGASRIAAAKLSLHAQTVMWLIEQFLPARFTTLPWGAIHLINVIPR